MAYDKPIERPFEELPEWFIRTLHSRMVTRRLPKLPTNDRVEGTSAGRTAPGYRSENGHR